MEKNNEKTGAQPKGRLKADAKRETFKTAVRVSFH